MKLQLKNKHIFFALGDIWEVLNYKLKFQINELVTKDSDLETVQEVEFTRSDLELVISSVNNKPQGMSREINPEMFMAILPQVQAIVQGELQGGWKLNDNKDNYTEAMLILQDMQQASIRNDNMKNMVIEQGKYKILNQ
jgi:hypothetical protein|nr:hypothetical protein [uncultured Flavobacterium sp.]